MNKTAIKAISIPLVFGIAFVAFIAFYHKILLANFISWDDGEVLLHNKDVHSFSIKSFFTKQYVGNYAPVSMIVFSLEWFIFKGNALGHHVMNLLIHFVNVILVYRFALIILKAPYKAILCALIFCFHPLQIETIAWVSAQNNIIYSLFFLSGLIIYNKYQTMSLKKYYVFTLVFFVLSLLSKPSAIVLPLCLLLLEFIQPNNNSFNWKQALFKISPFLLLSFLFAVITLYTRSEANFLNEHHHFNVIEKIGNAGFALAFYIWKFILPINLSVIYPYPPNALLTIVLGYIFLVVASYLIYQLVKKKKVAILLGILFFIANLLLVLQFIQFGEVLNADRYMYLPIIGLGLIVAYFINATSFSKQISVMLLLLLTLGLVSFKRSSVWHNSIGLYSDILKKYPHSYEALSSIGVEYMLKNDIIKANQCLTQAIKEYPDYYKSHYNRGLLYARTNQPQKAIDDFTRCLQLKKYTKAYTARAAVYYEVNEIEKAINDANSALTQNELNANANFVLANCYNDLNEFDKALFHYNMAIKTEPSDAMIYLKRAILFGKKQQFENCINDLNQAIFINNNLAEAYYWRGVAKYNINKNPCDDLNKSSTLGFEIANNALTKYCK